MASHVRHLLTRKQEMLIRRLLADGYTHTEAAAAAGISRRRLRTRLTDQLRDVRVGQGRGSKRNKFVDIPEAEIYARAKALRETWTDERRIEAWNPRWRGTSPPDDEG